MTSHSHDDFAFEPLPGLPAHPPKGEELLWQGRPDTMALAREAFGLHWIMGYFALVILWRGVTGLAMGGVPMMLAMGLPYVGLALAAAGIILVLARTQARATVYTITTARVAMRIGAALTITLNLPFSQVASASADLRKGGTGTIAIQTKGSTRISYLVCWPHVRPWTLRKAEPALRCIPEAAAVARILAEAAEARVSLPVVTRSLPLAAMAAE